MVFVSFDNTILLSSSLIAFVSVGYFSDLGLKIPDDLKVFGFDNTSHASICNPPLSTVDQQIYEQGRITAQITDRLLNGEKVDRVTETPLKPIYRHSCGCTDYNSEANFRALINQYDYFINISHHFLIKYSFKYFFNLFKTNDNKFHYLIL